MKVRYRSGNQNLERLCFCSFVFGSYQRFVPYYVYSIHRTYPDAQIKIFLADPLETRVKEAIGLLHDDGMDRLEIVVLKDLDVFRKYRIRGGGKKLIRWLLGSEHFRGCDYVYMGDVDILILPEQVSLLDYHKEQMERLELPFSNMVRADDRGMPTSRLTGLHFVKVDGYFEKVDPIIRQIWEDEHFRDVYLSGLDRDESFLYKLNKDAFNNFNEQVLSKAGRPWHGIHVGITRADKELNVKVIEENSSLSLEEIRRVLLAYTADPIFQKIQRIVFAIEIQRILKRLSIPYPLNWKIRAAQQRLSILKKRFIRHIVRLFS